jgi:hypothetical protein
MVYGYDLTLGLGGYFRGVKLPISYILYINYIYFYIYKTIKPYKGVGVVDYQRLMKYGFLMVLNKNNLKYLICSILKPNPTRF